MSFQHTRRRPPEEKDKSSNSALARTKTRLLPIARTQRAEYPAQVNTAAKTKAGYQKCNTVSQMPPSTRADTKLDLEKGRLARDQITSVFNRTRAHKTHLPPLVPKSSRIQTFAEYQRMLAFTSIEANNIPKCATPTSLVYQQTFPTKLGITNESEQTPHNLHKEATDTLTLQQRTFKTLGALTFAEFLELKELARVVTQTSNILLPKGNGSTAKLSTDEIDIVLVEISGRKDFVGIALLEHKEDSFLKCPASPHSQHSSGTPSPHSSRSSKKRVSIKDFLGLNDSARQNSVTSAGSRLSIAENRWANPIAGDSIQFTKSVHESPETNDPFLLVPTLLQRRSTTKRASLLTNINTTSTVPDNIVKKHTKKIDELKSLLTPKVARKGRKACPNMHASKGLLPNFTGYPVWRKAFAVALFGLRLAALHKRRDETTLKPNLLASMKRLDSNLSDRVISLVGGYRSEENVIAIEALLHARIKSFAAMNMEKRLQFCKIGVLICKQGNEAPSLYYILTGGVNTFHANETGNIVNGATIFSGEAFGTMDVENKTHLVSVKTQSVCEFIQIDKKSYQAMFSKDNSVDPIARQRKFLANYEPFKSNPSFLNLINSSVELVEYAPAELIFKASTKLNDICWILSGSVKCVKSMTLIEDTNSETWLPFIEGVALKPYQKEIDVDAIIGELRQGDHFPGLPTAGSEQFNGLIDMLTLKISIDRCAIGFKTVAVDRVMVAKIPMMTFARIADAKMQMYCCAAQPNILNPDVAQLQQDLLKEHKWTSYKKGVVNEILWCK